MAEMSEKDLIASCVKYAQGERVREETSFEGFIGGEALSDSRRALFRLSEWNAVKKYMVAYLQEHQRIAGEEANEIHFRDCWISSSVMLEPYSNCVLIFQHCKIEISTPQDHVALKAKFITNCNIALNGHVYCDEMNDTVLNGGCTLARANGTVVIKACHFSPSLQVHQAFISNSYIHQLKAGYALEIAGSEARDLRVEKTAHRLVIHDTVIGTSLFNQAEFRECAIFSKIRFEESPRFDGVTFTSRNVNFDNITFDDLNSEEALGTFRCLRGACSDAQYENGAILFHALELQTHYNLYLRFPKCKMKDWPEKISSIFHRLFTDYGRSTMLPVWWLFFIFVAGTELNMHFGTHHEPLRHLLLAAQCSLKNSLGPLIFALPDNGKAFCDAIFNTRIAIIEFFQITICGLIWFLLIFMIRRRFKLQ